MEKRGADAFQLSTPFDELQLVKNNIHVITRGCNLISVNVYINTGAPRRAAPCDPR